jgi:ribosomal protein L11 methyltransferase
LDVGTGSGILAIAAAKLGAGKVVGLDIRLDACRVARLNVRRNGLDDAVAVVAGTPAVIGSRARFELVVANLGSAADGRQWLRTLSSLCATGGKIILSGILAPEEGPPLTALKEANLTQLARRIQEDWVTLVLGMRP